ncbi:hypothetical protein [Chryseobacterium sp.]|uniref:hypothetical protein n=1 Tax=Chryseobacterium sp. TaxID=1871047 RepID=UPI0028982BD1|nr:hypothetical protein [Chryseobacterium sp.]
MSKKGIYRISGNTSPVVGKEMIYTIEEWYPDTPLLERNPMNVTWELFIKRKSGQFVSTSIKKKGISHFTFGEKAWRYTYRLEAYLNHPEGKEPMSLIINPQPSKVPQINKVELHYIDDEKGNVFSFFEKLRAKAHCVNLANEELLFTLWEDDVKGKGHDPKNLLVETAKAKVNPKNGLAVAEFMLTKGLMTKAMRGEHDGQLEFYVTVEYYKNKKHDSENVNVQNPLYKVPPPIKHESRQKPKETQHPTKAQGSPAAQKPKSKKEEKGIWDTMLDKGKELWDVAESKIATATKDKEPAKKVDKTNKPVFVEKQDNKNTDSTCVCKEYDLIWGGHASMTCEKRKKVVEVCKNIWGESQKIEKANMLMAVMHLETAATFDPAKKGVSGGGVKYIGLIQFSATTASTLGTTYDALAKMTFNEQMNYVEKYLKQKKDKMKTIVDFYLQVLKPGDVGKGDQPNHIVFDESISVPDGDGSNTTFEQRKINITREPWVTKYGYASNPPFMKEQGERTTRRKWVYTKQIYDQRYGFNNGKTYIWEIEDELKIKHYQPGENNKFLNKCENIKEEKKASNGKRAPWVDIAYEEYEKYKSYVEKESPLKEQISRYFQGTGNGDLDYTAPWCAAFIKWCFDHTADYKNINTKGTAAAFDWAGYQNSKVVDNKYVDGWKDGEECEPFVGAIMTFTFSHTAILVGENLKGDKYVYLGGNQGNGDSRSGYQKICLGSISKNSSKIFMIMKPKVYSVAEEEKVLPKLNVEAENSAGSSR